MNVLVAVVVVAFFAAAGSATDLDSPVVAGAAGAMPVFTRDEPWLAAGRRALVSDDVDTAIERFRRAATTTDTERAVVEYDVGQALTLRALGEAKAAQAARPPGGPTTTPSPPTPAEPAAPPNVDDALAAFERAATLGRDPRLVSEARLAAGNAALIGGKLEDAISQLRKAIVADPGNERAKRNLQRALTMKQQQPPPPPEEGDGDKSDEQKDGDKKDGEQKDGDGGQQGKKEDQQGEPEDGDKKDGDKKDGDKKEPEPADDQKDGGQQGDKSDGQQPEDPDEKKDAEGKATAPKPKPTSKDEARRLLQGIRSRERPLSPLEMRGVEKPAPATGGKDW